MFVLMTELTVSHLRSCALAFPGWGGGQVLEGLPAPVVHSCSLLILGERWIRDSP